MQILQLKQRVPLQTLNLTPRLFHKSFSCLNKLKSPLPWNGNIYGDNGLAWWRPQVAKNRSGNGPLIQLDLILNGCDAFDNEVHPLGVKTQLKHNTSQEIPLHLVIWIVHIKLDIKKTKPSFPFLLVVWYRSYATKSLFVIMHPGKKVLAYGKNYLGQHTLQTVSNISW